MAKRENSNQDGDKYRQKCIQSDVKPVAAFNMIPIKLNESE